MAKGKRGGMKNKPLQPSFFQLQRQKLGPGFMNRITTEDVRKNALKILTDLATGSANPDYVYEYFNQYDFTYNIYMVALDNFRYRQYVYTGLISNPTYQYDAEMQKVAAELYDQLLVYNSVVLHLYNILQGITMYNGVYTRFFLQQLSSEIRWKKNAFSSGIKLVITEPKTRNIKNKRRELPNDKGFSNQDEGGFFGKPAKNNV